MCGRKSLPRPASRNYHRQRVKQIFHPSSLNEAAPEVPPPSRREWLWLSLCSVLLFAATLALDTRHNDFPYFYHPDEAEKVRQVLTGEWNFHHPMLLLTTAQAGVAAWGVERREQSVVQAGRWVAAGFVAAAVVGLSLLAFAWRGWTAGAAAGGALLLHHQLFELAHYMKEDTALLMGMAWTFLAAFLFWRKPEAWRAALLGAAVALAISGKYVGVCMFAVALPVLWGAPGRTARGWAWFWATLAVVLVVVNLPLLLQPALFSRSFAHEADLVVQGQGGRRAVPHALYWSIFRDNSTPVVWVLLLVFLTMRWRERRAVSLVEWLVIAFPFAFTLLLSFSPKTNDRYFLPASAGFTLLAALGAVDAAKLLARRVPLRWALAVVAFVFIAAQLPDWRRYEEAFCSDDNAALLAWVQELPPDAVISKDSRVRLPEAKSEATARHQAPIPQKVLGGHFAADHGTFAAQRARGVTHVAVSESDYGRFFLRGLGPQPGKEEEFVRRKAFYEELLRDGGEPLFRRDRGTVLYLHPGLRVYRLPPADE